MQKIIANPAQINTDDVVALSEGTTMVKRYIEFICLREIQVPQFLLTTLNNLELALNKPLTTSGQAIVPLLANTSLELPLPEILIKEKTQFIHQLYKLSLHQFFKKDSLSSEFSSL